MTKVPLNKIHKRVAEHFKVDMDYMFQNSKKREVVNMRQIFHYMAHHFNPKMSISGIGRYGLLKDHSTVLHSIKTVKNLMDVDKQLKMEIAIIKFKCDKDQEEVSPTSFAEKKYELISKINEAKELRQIRKAIKEAGIFKNEKALENQ